MTVGALVSTLLAAFVCFLRVFHHKRTVAIVCHRPILSGIALTTRHSVCRQNF